jgi:hypothetical protein
MANRGASAAVQTEWAKVANQPAHLIEVRFDAGDGGTQYMTDSYRAISWGGNSYAPLGHVLSFQGISESAEMRVANASLTLSGVASTWISNLLTKNYIDRRLLVYKAFFNTSTEALIVDPVAIHDGRMDEPVLQEDPSTGKCEITLASRDQFADFERLTGRHTNSIDQNLWFPADRAFDLLDQNAGRATAIVWGKVPPAAPPGPLDLGYQGSF